MNWLWLGWLILKIYLVCGTICGLVAIVAIVHEMTSSVGYGNTPGCLLFMCWKFKEPRNNRQRVVLIWVLGIIQTIVFTAIVFVIWPYVGFALLKESIRKRQRRKRWIFSGGIVVGKRDWSTWVEAQKSHPRRQSGKRALRQADRQAGRNVFNIPWDNFKGFLFWYR